jgi:hypothetical protein
MTSKPTIIDRWTIYAKTCYHNAVVSKVYNISRRSAAHLNPSNPPSSTLLQKVLFTRPSIHAFTQRSTAIHTRTKQEITALGSLPPKVKSTYVRGEGKSLKENNPNNFFTANCTAIDILCSTFRIGKVIELW